VGSSTLSDTVLTCNENSYFEGCPSDREEPRLVAAFDTVLCDVDLQYLQELFSFQSGFWKQYGYDVNGTATEYFSFLHMFGEREAKSSPIDMIGLRIFEIAQEYFPEVKEANSFEWWAHCRPHKIGHQLHFDTDEEGMNGIINPIVSCVLYLSDSCGGGTLVTNQDVQSSVLGDYGWMVFPKVNRLVIFKGSVLHGVIPGGGTPQSHLDRRISVMFAFWKDGRPPVKHSLAKQIFDPSKLQEMKARDSQPNMSIVEPIFIPEIWQHVDPRITRLPKYVPPYEQCFQGI